MWACLQPDIFQKPTEKLRGQIRPHVTFRHSMVLWPTALGLKYIAVHIHSFIKFFKLSLYALRWLQDKLSNVGVFTAWHFPKTDRKTERSNQAPCDLPPFNGSVTYSFGAWIYCSAHSQLYKILWGESLRLKMTSGQAVQCGRIYSQRTVNINHMMQ